MRVALIHDSLNACCGVHSLLRLNMPLVGYPIDSVGFVVKVVQLGGSLVVSRG